MDSLVISDEPLTLALSLRRENKRGRRAGHTVTQLLALLSRLSTMHGLPSSHAI